MVVKNPVASNAVITRKATSKEKPVVPIGGKKGSEEDLVMPRK